ncbi:Short-chain dehydrogenase/reductase family protein [Mycena venus]|uniref:Short-chain dehydrogenase/reductase family protein n=1 Tax=Mycena venus TaxID=2733690 RepID=A0A8H6TWG5_9AGAR|nr:Short-chain dehydrogenase/reductase family protein [Mycena venus]
MHSFLRSAVAALRNTQKRFNSSALARIYTFRAVLVLNISTAMAQVLFENGVDPIVSGPCVFIVIHHLVMLYPWRIHWVVSAIDFLLVLAEFAYFLLFFLTVLPAIRSPIATFGWRFTLLSGCSTQLPYNFREVLFGRSALRPLVRGESRAIAFVRAIVLVSLCIAIPAFGCYFALVVPIRATVMIRNVRVAHPWLLDVSGFEEAYRYIKEKENITMVFFYVGPSDSIWSAVNVTIARSDGNTLRVSNSFSVADVYSPATTVACPYSWSDLASSMNDLIVSASFTDPRGTLYVKTGQGDSSDIDSYAEVIPLKAGFHLSAFLSRTQRQFFSKNAQDIFGLTTVGSLSWMLCACLTSSCQPFKSVTLNTVLTVQTDPSPPDLELTTLRLYMREDIGVLPAEIVQDYSDASVLNGIATFGGFWTFVNGAFAMIFGANLLYFLFRRRSLSALGIVHIFQRRTLIRKWNEDFPALHTEGGRPGSKSAGIVAFLRERLVDLDDEDHSGDLEAQNTTSEQVQVQVYHPVSMNDDAELSEKATLKKPKPHTDTCEMEEVPL